MKFKLESATDKVHKYIGVFDDTKRVPFGQFGASDYTLHKNRLRKELYLARHRSRENWADPQTAGALSRWILWNRPSLQESVKDFKRRFSLE